jgi:hypothetical protein
MKRALLLLIIFSVLIAACDNPFMKEILSRGKNKDLSLPDSGEGEEEGEYPFEELEDYDLQAEVDKYAAATGDMTIAVPYDFYLRANITVPAPANSNAVLTITSETGGGAYSIIRRFEDDNWYSGLFTITSGAKLVFENIIIDGKKEAYSDNKGSLVMVNINGDFTLKDGAVLQNNAVKSPGPGGAVNITGNREDGFGTFTMIGGEISGNTATSGGGVYLVGEGVVFTMTGGIITGNTANNGGGVYVDETCRFIMTGGIITGNAANNNGGGLCSFNADAKTSGGSITMSGTAEISGNTAGMNGGGVYTTGYLMVGGAVVINKNTVSSTANNLFLDGYSYWQSSYIYIGTGDSGDIPPPASGMNIGVRTAEDYSGDNNTGVGVIVNSYATSALMNYFHADEAGRVLTLYNSGSGGYDYNSQLVIMSQALLDFYDKVKNFATAAGDVIIEVPENLNLWISSIEVPANPNATLTIKSASGVVRTLNRKSYGYNDFVTVTSGAKLIFQNIEVNGNVKVNGGEFTLKDGAALLGGSGTLGVEVDNGGTFIMSGGSISGNMQSTRVDREPEGGGGVCLYNGTFTMTGGSITGNQVIGVSVSRNSSFTMSGSAKISGTTSGYYGNGSAVTVDGIFTMTGGEISGNQVVGVSIGCGSYFENAQEVSYNGTLNMSGGTISGNNGGGVLVDKSIFYNSDNELVNINGRFVVGGTSVVSGNATSSNVYLTIGSVITLGTGNNGVPAPATSMNIGVRTASDHNGVIVASGANATIAGYFKADEAGKSVMLQSGSNGLVIQ